MQMELQAVRQIEEGRIRYERFSKGLLKGIWDWITGRHAAIRRQNESEFSGALLRDRAEQQMLINRPLEERRLLHRQIREHEKRLERELESLQAFPKIGVDMSARQQAHNAEQPARRRRRRDLFLSYRQKYRPRS